MNFLNPTVLWALFFISIPIIIHLFNFRTYKTVYFSNIRFLSDIKNASQSKSKLKNYIILIFRILTITAIVLAFAGPYIPLTKNQISPSNRIVCLYIDNSFSMIAGSSHGNLLDASKERSRKIVNSYPNSQKFLLITNDLEAKHKILCTKEQVLVFINQCQLSPYTRKLSEIAAHVRNFVNEDILLRDQNLIFFFISDFQRIIVDFEKIETDSSLFYILPMATNTYNNMYIDSCWFSNSGRNKNKQEELSVRIVNKGEESYSDIPLKLFINGKQKVVGNFNIEKNQVQEVKLKYANTETGILSCYLEITDYPIMFDNTLYFNYRINDHTSILLIQNNLSNKYFSALFRNDSSFIVEQSMLANIKSSEFNRFHVIIIDEPQTISTGLSVELKQFVTQGGVLVVVPGANTSISDWNYLMNSINGSIFASLQNLSTEVGRINFDHYIYKDVFFKSTEKLILPTLKSFYDLNLNTSAIQNILLSSVSGKPLLIHHNYEKGKVYTFGFPLSVENSNFVLHPLFVPTFYNIAALSQSEQKLYYEIGKDKIIDINLKNYSDRQTLRITDSINSVDFIPAISGIGELGVRLNLMDNILKSGNYKIVTSDSALQTVSFNYSRIESEPECLDKDKLIELIKKSTIAQFVMLDAEMDNFEIQMDEILNERRDFWKFFVLLCLTFIIGEILTIRFWKE